jgi:hypothetical protein
MDEPIRHRANMLALLTPAEMSNVDGAAQASGMSVTSLMDASGRAVANAVQARWSKRPVTILCGPGIMAVTALLQLAILPQPDGRLG